MKSGLTVGYSALTLVLCFCRIIPRHRFLQLVRAQPIHPFPMNYLKMSDDKFATNVAETSLARFASFRDQMVAKDIH